MVWLDVYHYVNFGGPGGDLWIWCGYLPLCVFLAFFFLRESGPQDVGIDLEARVCHAVRGWMCFLHRFDFPLDDASLYVYPGGYGCYVALGVMADKEYRFMLAKADSMDAAKSEAQDIGEQLGLLVRVTTYYGMRQDIARAKRKG